MRIKPPSSSGLGHLSFKEATGIRIPLGVLSKNYCNSQSLHKVFYIILEEKNNKVRLRNNFIIFLFFFFGSVLEWLMGTDCKSAGNAYAGSNPARPKTLLNFIHIYKDKNFTYFLFFFSIF